MATVPIATEEDSDDETDDGTNTKIPSDTLAMGDVENMATVPMAMEDDSDTDVSEEGGVSLLSAEQPTQAVDGVEEALVNEATQAVADTLNAAELKTGLEDAPTLALADEPTQAIDNALDMVDAKIGLEDAPTLAIGDDAGNGEEKDKDEESEEFDQREKKEMDSGEEEIGATQPYGTLGDNSKSALNDDDKIDATQPYRDGGEHSTSVAMETDFTQPYGDDAGERGMEIGPTVPYVAQDEDAMDTEDSEVEATQAYGDSRQ